MLEEQASDGVIGIVYAAGKPSQRRCFQQLLAGSELNLLSSLIHFSIHVPVFFSMISFHLAQQSFSQIICSPPLALALQLSVIPLSLQNVLVLEGA